jgi:hypothetical protein
VKVGAASKDDFWAKMSGNFATVGVVISAKAGGRRLPETAEVKPKSNKARTGKIETIKATFAILSPFRSKIIEELRLESSAYLIVKTLMGRAGSTTLS